MAIKEKLLKEQLQIICGLHNQKGDFWKAIADAKDLLNKLYPEEKRKHIKYQWKTIPNFNNYEISTKGEVRRAKVMYQLKTPLPVGQLLKPLKKNYIQYRLVNDEGKQKFVCAHRLVALTFLGEPPFKDYVVAHLDGTRFNNDVNNLKWVSNSENQLHRRIHHKDKIISYSKLKPNDVKKTKTMYNNGMKQSDIAKEFKVSHGVINRIINKVTYLREVYN